MIVLAKNKVKIKRNKLFVWIAHWHFGGFKRRVDKLFVEGDGFSDINGVLVKIVKRIIIDLNI